MIDKHDELYRDIESVKSIPIVPTILDTVCRITGMGFAAVARVTETRWVACSVDDRVNFGLAAGSELEVKTTICDEIRSNRKEVVIDHVDRDEHFRHHHTPKLYGLQSYISFPIILRSGEFFGTLCAIDSKPAALSKPEILSTFKLFAELLAFHLESIDLVSRSHSALQESNKKLDHVSIENELYKKVSDHNIKEQARKIALFSGILVNDTEDMENQKIQKTAAKINAISNELRNMIEQVAKYSQMDYVQEPFATIDLNEIVSGIRSGLADDLAEKKIAITTTALPLVSGMPSQLRDMFFHLVSHAMLFSSEDHPASINIYSKDNAADEEQDEFCEIIVEEKGIGPLAYDLKNIFDIFLHSKDVRSNNRYDTGLAYCRKIVQNHGGTISVKPIVDNSGVAFSILLPAVNISDINQ